MPWLVPRVPVPIGWAVLHAPGRLAGLITVLAAAVVLPVLLHTSLPRRWRAGYRRWRGRKGARSAYITARQRRAVYVADWHRCVYCGAWTGLQVDHVVPWSHGGRTVLWNLVTLCAYHNRVKSDYWPGEGYRPFDGHDYPALAAAILAAELRARRRPLRWVRAALALAA